ncbi:MAG: cardiolipin synthase [Prevotella sp.]|nr:cardiolipin synthase [Prevotella sp.]
MIYVHWLILLVYGLAVVGAMVRVLMDNRQPAKTMAWMLVLTFLPLLGIILYFFFGQNTRKERLISQQSLDQLTKRSMLEFVEQKDLVVPDNYKTLVQLFATQNWALPFKDNRTDIFTNGYDFFGALLHDISQARHHIHLDTYIFDDDALGHLIADALISQARRGVEVRVIYDDVGCWNVKGSFFERLRDAGIEVHAFMPVKFPAFTSKVNYRNHRKLCVIDGRVGYIGGMNIATRYIKGRQGQGWRDTHLRIRGNAVYGIQKAFLVDWYFVDRTLISNRKYYPAHESEGSGGQFPMVGNNSLVQIVTSSPIAQWPSIMQGYVRILLGAKDYVYIESPYFIPTEPVLFAMRTAALAGVDVRLMIPLHTDAKLVEWASRSYVMETVEAGVKVYLYQPCFNHSKLLVCDDTLCTCGSTNVDFRSFENNFEANAFFYDRDMALRMKQVFVDDMARCVQLSDVANLEHRRPFVHRLWESLVRMVAPLL